MEHEPNDIKGYLFGSGQKARMWRAPMAYGVLMLDRIQSARLRTCAGVDGCAQEEVVERSVLGAPIGIPRICWGQPPGSLAHEPPRLRLSRPAGTCSIFCALRSRACTGPCSDLPTRVAAGLGAALAASSWNPSGS